MRHTGKITTWKDDKGFGFITINGTQDKIFVHINAFSNRSRRPVEGDQLTFEVTQDAQRRSNATNVKFANEKFKNQSSSNKTLGLSSIFGIVYCIVLSGLFMLGKIPLSAIGIYLILGIITFIAYAIDKSAAQKNQWRTKESTLHVLSLSGGWIGALLAQQTLRHKSKKQEFQTVFWITVILNCGAFGWLLIQGHFESLKRIIGF